MLLILNKNAISWTTEKSNYFYLYRNINLSPTVALLWKLRVWQGWTKKGDVIYSANSVWNFNHSYNLIDKLFWREILVLFCWIKCFHHMTNVNDYVVCRHWATWKMSIPITCRITDYISQLWSYWHNHRTGMSPKAWLKKRVQGFTKVFTCENRSVHRKFKQNRQTVLKG